MKSILQVHDDDITNAPFTPDYDWITTAGDQNIAKVAMKSNNFFFYDVGDYNKTT